MDKQPENPIDNSFLMVMLVSLLLVVSAELVPGASLFEFVLLPVVINGMRLLFVWIERRMGDD